LNSRSVTAVILRHAARLAVGAGPLSARRACRNLRSSMPLPETAMTPPRPTRSLLALLVLATALPLALAGCEEKSPEELERIAELRERGRTYAWEHDFTKVSDCGALKDMDERHGCAAWVEERD
jgi:hypothetical protein